MQATRDIYHFYPSKAGAHCFKVLWLCLSRIFSLQFLVQLPSFLPWFCHRWHQKINLSYRLSAKRCGTFQDWFSEWCYRRDSLYSYSFLVHKVLSRCWVETPHSHTSERDSLFFQSCLLSTVTVTPSHWDYVNRSDSLKRFRLKSRRRAASCGGWAAELLSCRHQLVRVCVSCHVCVYETQSAAGKILGRNKMRHTQDSSNKMRRRPIFLDKILMRCLSCWRGE